MLTKLHMLLLPLLLILASGPHAAAPADATAVIIPQVTSLQSEARLASRHNMPILIMISADHCRYCTMMENDFLKPMLFSGDYDDRILIRKLKLSGRATLTDFDGQTIRVRDFARRYQTRLTPTLLFLDGEGRELVEKMTGITTPDFFASYLDAAIHSAYRNLQEQNKK